MGLDVTSHEEDEESQAGRGEKQQRVLFIVRTYCKGVFVTASQGLRQQVRKCCKIRSKNKQSGP